MPPAIVYSGLASSTDSKGTLFEGKKFFLLQKIPSRSRFIDDVVNNGGTVVKLEAQADFIIADHIRKDAPAGSLSYKFIERAIKDGKLPPEEDHLAAAKAQGKGSLRAVASSAPNRTTRTPFTTTDDVQLYIWVKKAEAKGISVKGLDIYKQLEEVNPRHTFHSWRDRYIRNLVFNPPKDLPLPTPPADQTSPAAPAVKTPAVKEPGPAAAKTTATKDGPTTAKLPRPSIKPPSKLPPPRSARLPTTTATGEHVSKIPYPTPALVTTDNGEPAPTSGTIVEHCTPELRPTESAELQEPTTDAAQDDGHVDDTIVPLSPIDPASSPSTIPGFESEDLDDWLSGAEAVQNISVGEYQQAWDSFAAMHPSHTGQEWRAYYEQVVLPIYLENKGSLPQSAGKGRFRAIQAAFLTQGQPVYKPSTHPKPAAPTASSSSAPLILPKKRKSFELETDTKEPRKRQEVETADDGIHMHVESQLPTSTQAGDHIRNSSIESPVPKELDRISAEKVAARETREDDVISLMSDTDAAIQNQLREEMVYTQTHSHTNGAALTVENLALAQAEHRQDKRALDIVPDDEGKDQGAFADSLVQLLQQVPSTDKDRLEALKVKSQHLDAMARRYEAEGEVEDDEDDNSVHANQPYAQFGPKAVLETIEAQDPASNMNHPSPLRHSPEASASIGTNASPQQTPQKIGTQDIDPTLLNDYSDDEGDMQLDVPDPVGGWSATRSHQSTPIQSTTPRNMLSTQQIFDAETQSLDDFDPAQPDGFSHDPALAAASDMMSENEISVFVTEHLQHGYTEKQVRQALYYTSMRQRQSSIVLGHLRRTKEYPVKTAGVWSEQDDRWLEGRDAVKLRALNDKHGSAECYARMHFLEKHRKRA